VIGADPRSASGDDGAAGVALAAGTIAAALARALASAPGERERYRAALAASLGALDRLAELRATLPRDQVPPPLTPAWRAHLEAMNGGDWERARAAAEAKRDDPAS
jgi:hypothetical protein